MLTGRIEFTVIVTELLVAGLPVAHVTDEFKIQETLSPLAGLYV
jgi:hypothetical protein